MKQIKKQSGVSFYLKKGERLKVTSASGAQVADLFCFSKDRPFDALSSGRSIDYNETIYLTTGHSLYSNKGLPMLKIIEDTCGRHDFLVTPCSLQMFQMIEGNKDYHPSCHENLCESLAIFDKPPELITTTFNIFMNFEMSTNGKITLKEPANKPNDSITFEALEDLVVGLTACSDEATNGGSCKAVEYEIL